ncbi:phosphotransferase [Parafrankia sp. EUN1f]|uniref:maltokinase N-terminal cap-like domain-containing protein n=1 Tax=Parafrankia sp. EUN1f TaxID=102897 RepID=UPI0001C46C03|nr:phosphotransferase [Parafrankia sp. EUN1f]EFC80816.1 aminoglycoside phosphotransferase [Parafrankia sp. EUN1f]
MTDQHSELADLLVDWLPRQRWFAGKGRAGGQPRVVQDVQLSSGRNTDTSTSTSTAASTSPAAVLRLLVIEVEFDDGGPADYYQVPVVIRPDSPFGHDTFLIGESSIGLVYDGLRDTDGNAALLAYLRRGASREGLTATTVETLDEGELPPRSIGAEQSNTSIVYGEAYILKVFRRLWPGMNPDLEITRVLARAGSEHVARPVAWLSGQLSGVPTTFAFMQDFLRTGAEGWLLALASVRDLYAEGDLHADEVGGDFAAEAERLGAATAQVHRHLAAALPTRPADPAALAALADYLHRRLDDALAALTELAPFEATLRAAYDEVRTARHLGPFQRIHGDLHLGQVLRVESGWVLFDFEGEPARPVPDRTQLESPLRDVAGMLRSFDYAAQSMLLERPDEPALAYRALEWADHNRDAFCRGYGAESGRDPRDDHALLRALELDKAVYEVLYETRHRPGWISIPMRSIERLTSEPEGRGAAAPALEGSDHA